MEEEDPPKLTALFEVFDRSLPELEKAGPGYKKVTKASGRLTQATEACKVLINVPHDFYRDAGYSALRKVHQQDPTLELQSPRSGRRRLKTEADVVMATAKYVLGYIDECIETLYPNLSYQQSEAGPFRPRKKPNKGAEALQQEDDLQEELHIPDIRNSSATNGKLTLHRHEMTIPGQKNAKKRKAGEGNSLPVEAITKGDVFSDEYADLKPDANATEPSHSIRFDLCWTTDEEDESKRKTIAIIEFKRHSQISYDDFRKAVVKNSPSEINEKLDAYKYKDSLIKNGLKFNKQTNAYALESKCPYVALFNWDALLVFHYHELGLNPEVPEKDIEMAEFAYITDEGQEGRIQTSLLGFLYKAFERIGLGPASSEEPSK